MDGSGSVGTGSAQLKPGSAAMWPARLRCPIPALKLSSHGNQSAAEPPPAAHREAAPLRDSRQPSDGRPLPQAAWAGMASPALVFDTRGARCGPCRNVAPAPVLTLG